MTIEEFLAVRRSQQARNDFLAWLAQKERRAIGKFSRRLLGSRASDEFICGEATQAFLLAANRAIDSAANKDDGRGRYDPVAWVRFKALNGVKDFIRYEYAMHSRLSYPQRKFENSFTSYFNLGASNEPKIMYEERIVNSILLEPIFENMTPIDREILDVLILKRKDIRVSRVTLRVAKEMKCQEKTIIQWMEAVKIVLQEHH